MSGEKAASSQSVRPRSRWLPSWWLPKIFACQWRNSGPLPPAYVYPPGRTRASALLIVTRASRELVAKLRRVGRLRLAEKCLIKKCLTLRNQLDRAITRKVPAAAVSGFEVQAGQALNFRRSPAGRFLNESIITSRPTHFCKVIHGSKIFVRIATPFGPLGEIICDQRVDSGGSARWVDNIHVRQD